MSSEAGWADLFAAAAGSTASHSNIAQGEAATSGISEDRPKKKKRKKRNRKPNANTNVTVHSHYGDSGARARVVSSRIHSPSKEAGASAWLQLGPSLSMSATSFSAENQSNRCQGWLEHGGIAGTGKSSFRVCKYCTLSPMYHSLSIDFSRISPTKGSKYDGKVAPLSISLFAAVRDLRCCGSVAAERLRGNQLCMGYTKVALDKMNYIMLHHDNLGVPAGEAEILRGKCQSLRQKVLDWNVEAKELFGGLATNRKSASDLMRKWRFFERTVEVIMACDAVYYRLYYLQITGVFPILRLEKNIDAEEAACIDMFIPHPSIYFGELVFDVSSGESCLEAFANEIIRDPLGGSSREKVTNCLLQHGVAHLVATKEDINRTHCQKHHPLEYLHYFRLLEMIVLFWGSGWVQSKERTREFGDILGSMKYKAQSCSTDSEFYVQHETPALPLISKFRDSVRDFPCNLYAYACVPSSSIEKLKEILVKMKMTNGVVELGAGTGYMACLLAKCGLQVTALDVAPTCSDPEKKCQKTDTINEYHGSTPSFVPVQRSNVSGLKIFLRSGYIARRAALLLCYPPPLSNMAGEALQSYISLGGSCLIHIGEFQGLTGSQRFEDLLVQNFQCIERLPCLEWGTDAANLTVWVKKPRAGLHDTDNEKHSKGGHSDLLPCSNCRRKPAVRRCRLARSLVYCGHRCFDLHSAIRKVHLALHMTFVECNYDDDKHFADLDSFRADFKGEKTCSSVTPKMGRRRKRGSTRI